MQFLEKNSEGLNFVEGTLDSAEYLTVLIHGYGANMHDLADLGIFLMNGIGSSDFIFPNGPLTVPIGPGMSGHGWFPIQPEVFEQGYDAKERLFPVKEIPEGFSESISLLTKLFSDRKEKKIILGGFSQGAMIAAHMALSGLVKPTALLLFSGAFLLKEQWEQQVPADSFPIFQSHGSSDPLLLFSQAERLKDFLQEQGFSHSWHPFSGGHEIPMDIVQSAKSFLTSL